MRDTATGDQAEMREVGTEIPRGLARDAAVQAVEAEAKAVQQGCWNCRSFLH